MGGEGATSILSVGWSEVMTGVDEIMGNQYAKLGLLLPLVSIVISVARKLFRRK